MSSILKRMISIVPFIAIIPIISLLLFSSWYSYRMPSDGMDWSPVDGSIQVVRPTGSVYGVVWPGDIILSIDG